VQPYLDYPNLMPIAAAVLPATKNAPWNLRCEVLRTFGILGALEPQRFVTSAELSKTQEEALMLDAHTAKGEISMRKNSHPTNNPNSSSAIDIQPRVEANENNLTASPNHNKLVNDHLSEMNESAANSGFALGESKDSNFDPAHLYMYEQCAMTAQPVASSNPFKSEVTPSSEDFFPTVAVKALMKILKVRLGASEAAYQGGGSMMTYKTSTITTIMRVAGSATSAMRKPQSLKRVRNDEP
jgi:hypothetical protein